MEIPFPVHGLPSKKKTLFSALSVPQVPSPLQMKYGYVFALPTSFSVASFSSFSWEVYSISLQVIFLVIYAGMDITQLYLGGCELRLLLLCCLPSRPLETSFFPVVLRYN